MDRRVLVVDEQQRVSSPFRREVFEGDISNPDVWKQLTDVFDLTKNPPAIILGTDSAGDNLRTALWIKRTYPDVYVFARTNDVSCIAVCAGSERGVRHQQHHAAVRVEYSRVLAGLRVAGATIFSTVNQFQKIIQAGVHSSHDAPFE
jgi:hypothetical protein